MPKLFRIVAALILWLGVALPAHAGIFDDAALRKVLSDRIAAWGVADAPELAEFTAK